MKVGSFSWRLLIGWILIIFGGLLNTMINILGPLHFLTVFFFTSHHPVFRNSPMAVAAGSLLQFVAGLIWFFAGRQILKNKTWWPLVWVLVAYIAGVCGAMLLGMPGP